MKWVLDVVNAVNFYGVLGAVAFVFNEIRIKRAEQVDDFDRQFGTDTAGKLYPWHLGSLRNGDRKNEIYPYEGVPGQLLKSILSRLSFDFERFSFIDLGCGKGRALLLASEFPFSKIVGVEITPELHEIAKENVEKYIATTQNFSNFELLCLDARLYEFESTPLVLFLFNPFGEQTFDTVLSRLEASVMENPRQVTVIYVNPRLESRLAQSGLFRKVFRGGSLIRPWYRYVIYITKWS